MLVVSHPFHADGLGYVPLSRCPACPWRGHGCIFRRPDQPLAGRHRPIAGRAFAPAADASAIGRRRSPSGFWQYRRRPMHLLRPNTQRGTSFWQRAWNICHSGICTGRRRSSSCWWLSRLRMPQSEVRIDAKEILKHATSLTVYRRHCTQHRLRARNSTSARAPETERIVAPSAKRK